MSKASQFYTLSKSFDDKESSKDVLNHWLDSEQIVFRKNLKQFGVFQIMFNDGSMMLTTPNGVAIVDADDVASCVFVQLSESMGLDMEVTQKVIQVTGSNVLPA